MPPDSVAKQLLLAVILLGLAGTQVASQYGHESTGGGTCKWPHNSTSPGQTAEQVGLSARSSYLSPHRPSMVVQSTGRKK